LCHSSMLTPFLPCLTQHLWDDVMSDSAPVGCRFDSEEGPSVVVRETKHMEGTFDELRAAGASCGSKAFADADSTAAVMNAIAPAGVKLFELHCLQLKGFQSSGVDSDQPGSQPAAYPLG